MGKDLAQVSSSVKILKYDKDMNLIGELICDDKNIKLMNELICGNKPEITELRN